MRFRKRKLKLEQHPQQFLVFHVEPIKLRLLLRLRPVVLDAGLQQQPGCAVGSIFLPVHQ